LSENMHLAKENC